MPLPRRLARRPLPISVGVEMDGCSRRLQTVEGWTRNKVIKALRMGLPQFGSYDLDGQGAAVMTWRPHLAKLAISDRPEYGESWWETLWTQQYFFQRWSAALT